MTTVLGEARNAPGAGHKSHPQVIAIVDEIEMHGGNDAALSDARFERWRTLLAANYPRRDNAVLYGQLLTMSLNFAVYRCTAAVQLFHLSSIGLSPEQVERVVERDPRLQKLVEGGPPAGPSLSPAGGGVSLSGGHSKKKRKPK